MASSSFSNSESSMIVKPAKTSKDSTNTDVLEKPDDCDLWSDADEDELVKLDYSEADYRHSSFSLGCSLECDQMTLANGTPQKQFRPCYLIVSDFAKQHWCEMQLLYSFAPELALLRALPGEDVKLEESDASKAIKGKGSDIHLERELEIQVPVEVPIETKEDVWAVKLINLQQAVLSFCKGQRLAREIPVFGSPFDCGFFLLGVIDELRYDPDTHAVEISELKTRRFQSLPKRGQQEKDKYQINLYAQLFNELVQGKVTKDMVASNLGLNLETALSEGVMKHIHNVKTSDALGVCTFGELLETVLLQVQSLCCISKSRIEYVHQETRQDILVLNVELDLESFRPQFVQHCQWWRGERGTTGVDVEDCWKCEYCQFSPLCEWRDHMAQKLSKKANQKVSNKRLI